jgi:hypothetical protein
MCQWCDATGRCLIRIRSPSTKEVTNDMIIAAVAGSGQSGYVVISNDIVHMRRESEFE